MAHPAFDTLLRYLRRLGDPSTVDASDRELLRRHLVGDEAAFAALLHRHAPLVWGVCRRLLDNEQDAEDAFQAVFLVLLRKADSLRVEESLANWLHAVAWRIAHKARVTIRRQRLRETRAETVVPSDPFAAVEQHDLRALLDEELERLPEKYRAPLVLCYLEGKTYAEAARQLSWKEGTVCGRLARARELLRQRLMRRGVTLSGAALIAALTETTSAPATTVSAVAKMAALFALGQAAGGAGVSAPVATLAQGVLHAMTVAKLKTMAMLVVVLGVCAAGAGWTAHWVLVGKPENTEPKPAVQAPQSEAVSAARKDHYGDPLPPGVLVRLGTTRFRAGGGISSLAFSPDGKSIASSSGDGITRIWDRSSGKQIRELPALRVSSLPVAFRPDGKILAVGLTLYDVASGKQVVTMTPPRLDPLYSQATSVAFSPDGKLLATGETKLARLWDAASGKQLRKLDVCRFFNPVSSIAFSPDGKTLATGGRYDEHALRLWDVATGKERFGVRGNPVKDNGSVKALAFAPDGKTLATLGEYENTIRLWDAANGRELRQFRGHTAPPYSLAFSPDGKQLISSGGRNFDPALPPDDTVRVWDVAGGKEQHRLSDEGAYLVAFSPDGKTIASTWGSAIRLWNAATGKPIEAQPAPQGSVQCIALAPDGKTIATRTPQHVHIWDAASGKELRRLAGEKGAGKIAFAPDGRLLAVPEEDGSIRFWDAASGREQKQRRLRGHKGKVNEVVFFSDGKTLLSAGEDGTTRLWNLAEGKELRQMIGRTPGKMPKGLPGTAMSPMPSNGATRAAIRVACVAVAPDGKTLASGCSDNTVRVWDAATGKQIHQLAEQGPVAAVAFSPDGRLLASAADKVRLWELASGKVRTEIAQYGQVLAFSPDGRTLASSASDASCETYLWDVRSGKLWGRLAGHRGPVVSLAYSRDGKRLVTGSEDTTALLWDMSDLTPERRRQMLSLSPQELEAMWLQLGTVIAYSGDSGSGIAFPRAVWRLSTVPSQTVPFLAKRLRPKILDLKKIPKWIADLDSKDREVMRQAFDNLMEIGDAAKPALREALKGKPTPQSRELIEGLLEGGIDGPLDVDEERMLKAVEVLRLIDNAESRALLEKLAAGTPGARLTRAAAAALK